VAKGKSAKTPKPRAAAKSAAPPKIAGRPKSNNQPATAAPEFTGIAIGHAAGEVWVYLNGGEPRTIADIKKSVNAPADVVVAAIGWLAREDKLQFVTNGKTVKIGLR
jgi:hypothetical protein